MRLTFFVIGGLLLANQLGIAPRIRVFEIQIEGPINKQWPAKRSIALLCEHEPTLANAETILHRFAIEAAGIGKPDH
ncbi:MAG: hypothetical protein WCO86_04445 [Planctomycetota bacterium]